MKNDSGVSEVIDETFIIILVVIAALVVGGLLFGFIVPIEKSAYLVPQFGLKEVAGKTVITVLDKGGDPLYFSGNAAAKYQAAFYVDTADGSYKATPASTLTVFKPGDQVFLYYTGSGFIVTDNLPGSSLVDIPAGGLVVRIVDSNTGTMIAKETLVAGTLAGGPISATPAPTASVTTTATVTPTATITATPTATATVTATATTVPPAALSAGFAWVNRGSNNVQFTDTSTGSPTSWVWDFNDGDTTQTRTGRTVTHKFPGKGTYKVILTITRSSDGATSSASAMVTVD